eukprot:TRINITY_DN13192_c0_g1_i1.p1 TRINITY_DN13192_c0_g1~~TRINITY_DN13192_c0_g1_i1.p1  ORF type:complete len:555 (+),score=75.85 TRINITY_DN13192_c0_g1_i1:112-1776(+)
MKNNNDIFTSDDESISFSDFEDEDMPLTEENIFILSKPRKIIYGFGNFARISAKIVLMYYLEVFLLEVASIGALYTALLVLILNFWDAITDPIVGRILDRFRDLYYLKFLTQLPMMSDNSPWWKGVRKLMIFMFIVPTAFTWVLQFTVLNIFDGNQTIKFLYFLLMFCAYSTCATCISVPYMSLVPDIAPTYDARSSIVLYQQVFGLLGSVITGFIVSLLIVSYDYEGLTNSVGYFMAAVTTLPIIIIPYIFSILVITERKPTFQNAPKYGIGREIEKDVEHEEYEDINDEEDEEETYRNSCMNELKEFGRALVPVFTEPTFLYLYITFIIASFGYSGFVTNIFLFIQYILKEKNLTPYLIVSIQIAILLGAIFFYYISKRFGKKTSYFFGNLVSCVGYIMFGFVGHGDVTLCFISVIIIGFGLSVGRLIPFSLLPDCIAKYENETGRRYEGLLYSIFILIGKLTFGITMGLGVLMLFFSGYESPDSKQHNSSVVSSNEALDQPLSFQISLRVIIAVIPFISSLLSTIFAFFIPIKRDDNITIKRKKDSYIFAF